MAYGSLKVYLAGIIRMHVEAGFHNTIRDDELLYLTMQGIKRQHGEVRRPRLPITIHKMRIIKEALARHPLLCHQDKGMLWAAFTLAFFGFLRVSEFTSPTTSTFDPSRTLLVQDIALGEVLSIKIKASKTDPFCRGCVVTIAPSRAAVCAVEAYKAHVNMQPRSRHVPAFQFQNGQFLTRQAVTQTIQDLLTRAGVPDVHCYTSHSFRSGAATTAAEAHLPDWLIKTLGRWRSDAYQVYINTPRSVKATVPLLLATL